MRFEISLYAIRFIQFKERNIASAFRFMTSANRIIITTDRNFATAKRNMTTTNRIIATAERKPLITLKQKYSA